jgi:hypothetical protein
MRPSTRTRPLIGRLAFAVLRSYPHAWRERYEDEVRTLLEDIPPRRRDVCELVRGLIVERVRELLSNDRRPRLTAALLGLLNPVFAIALVAAAAFLGRGLLAALGEWPQAARDIYGLSLVAAMPVTLAILIRARNRPFDFATPSYAPWVGMAFLPCLFAAITLAVWGQPFESDYRSRLTPFTVSYNWVLVCLLASDLASSVFPTHRMLAAFRTMQAAEQHIASNTQLAASCREWIARGVPSPLEQAEQEVVRWTGVRDAAIAQVRALGYRSRFQPGINIDRADTQRQTSPG